jgi:tetratricopeptide (TPR) repeat protein
MDNTSRFDQLIAQGLAASAENRSDAALELFAQASAVSPASGVPHFLIGSEHASAGNMEAAELAFANAVLLAPDFHIARYQLGLLQFSSQRAAVAVLTWQPLYELPEGDPFGHFVRGFAALAEDRLRESLTHFRDGLDRNVDNPALAADIGKVIEAVEGLLRRQPADAKPDAALGHILLSGYSGGLH